jgi:ubiquinone/menaquinone biosynthesis C-methylase UbiE
MEMQERINAYWSKRAEEFSHFRLLDLAGPQRMVWREIISQQLPKREGKLRALDAGTGAGFYAFILAELGCETTGIDYSQDMIDQAKANAAMLHFPPVRFLQMDAQSMSFADESFDFIISRNVTWTVPEPEKVYSEWFRLLTPGGVVMNIDANYGYVFKKSDESGWTAKQNAKWEQSEKKLIGTRPDMVNERNDIAKNLSVAARRRPQWDLDLMLRLGFREVTARANYMEVVFPNMPKWEPPAGEKTFEPDEDAPDTRIFMVKGVK